MTASRSSDGLALSLDERGRVGRRVEIGNCLLICDDCRDVLPSFGPVDAIVTSPPYNAGKDYRSSSDDLPIEQFEAFLTETLFSPEARVRVINVGEFVGSRHNRYRFADVLHQASGCEPLRDHVIWDKGAALGAAWGNRPNSPRVRAQHENVFVYGDTRMPNGNGLDWADWSRLTTSIWRIAPNVDLSLHPAMMPLDLACRMVRLWSDTEGVVCDPFMGSGTTGVACVRAGRRFVGIENDPASFELAIRRITEAIAQPDLFAGRALPCNDLLHHDPRHGSNPAPVVNHPSDPPAPPLLRGGG